MEKPPYSSSSLLLPLLLCSLQFEMRSLKRLASYEPEEEDDDWKADELDAVKCLLLELEPFFRSVLQEELQRLLSLRVSSSSIRDPSGNQIQAISAASRWRLSFVGELPDRLFTGGKIETRDGTSIKIFIEDRSSGSVVSFGALSAARVEIVVLDGDFDGRDQAGWTERDFADGVVKEREGRRPLLAGDVTVGLRGGAATLGPLFFTDNSSWTRSRKFRLGARVLSSTAPRVLEAVSGAFTVKDHRGERKTLTRAQAEEEHCPQLSEVSVSLVQCTRSITRRRWTTKSGAWRGSANTAPSTCGSPTGESPQSGTLCDSWSWIPTGSAEC